MFVVTDVNGRKLVLRSGLEYFGWQTGEDMSHRVVSG